MLTGEGEDHQSTFNKLATFSLFGGRQVFWITDRSLNIDFLLGYLKRLLARCSDLKLIISSATIDAERFSRHFEGAPVIAIEGRGFPISTEYWAGDRGEEAYSDRKSVV